MVVSGGTGALGRAVIEAFVAAGAVCHVPHRSAAPADLEALRIACASSLASASPTRRTSRTLYADLPALWASVHAAERVHAAAPTTATTLADLRTLRSTRTS